MDPSKCELKLSSRQRNLINSSWRFMQEQAGVANPLFFYEAFFKRVPEAQKFFLHKGREDFEKLGRKFKFTLDFIVDNIFRLEEKVEEMEGLGALHNRLNIPHDYYSLFNETLIGLLDEVLAERNTQEIKDAWKIALDYITCVMKSAPEKKVNKFQLMLKKVFG